MTIAPPSAALHGRFAPLGWPFLIVLVVLIAWEHFLMVSRPGLGWFRAPGPNGLNCQFSFSAWDNLIESGNCMTMGPPAKGFPAPNRTQQKNAISDVPKDPPVGGFVPAPKIGPRKFDDLCCSHGSSRRDSFQPEKSHAGRSTCSHGSSSRGKIAASCDLLPNIIWARPRAIREQE